MQRVTENMKISIDESLTVSNLLDIGPNWTPYRILSFPIIRIHVIAKEDNLILLMPLDCTSPKLASMYVRYDNPI